MSVFVCTTTVHLCVLFINTSSSFSITFAGCWLGCSAHIVHFDFDHCTNIVQSWIRATFVCVLMASIENMETYMHFFCTQIRQLIAWKFLSPPSSLLVSFSLSLFIWLYLSRANRQFYFHLQHGINMNFINNFIYFVTISLYVNCIKFKAPPLQRAVSKLDWIVLDWINFHSDWDCCCFYCRQCSNSIGFAL